MRLAWHIFTKLFGHKICQLVLCNAPSLYFSPLFMRLEHHVGIRHVYAHGISRDFRCADTTKDVIYLWKLFEQHFFAALLHVDAGINADTRRSYHMRRKRAFI